MKNRKAAALLFILTLLLSMIMTAAVCYADAGIESMWPDLNYVDYDVKISAPDGGVNFRNGPGVEYDQLISGMIPNGTTVHVNMEARASNGKWWGEIVYEGCNGWIFLGQTTKISSQPEPAPAAEPVTPQPPVQQEPQQDQTQSAPAAADSTSEPNTGEAVQNSGTADSSAAVLNNANEENSEQTASRGIPGLALAAVFILIAAAALACIIGILVKRTR